jgi:hypothetical protein
MRVDDVQLGGEVVYDAMVETVGNDDEGDYGDGDCGIGYDENMGDGAAQHVPESSHDGDDASWPRDVDYAQHMHGLHAKDQDGDIGALWISHHGRTHYCAAADEELQSPHLQVLKNPGFQRSKDHHAIPLDPDAIVNHFDTPHKPK